jgi:hypothetical protein
MHLELRALADVALARLLVKCLDGAHPGADTPLRPAYISGAAPEQGARSSNTGTVARRHEDARAAAAVHHALPHAPRAHRARNTGRPEAGAAVLLAPVPRAWLIDNGGTCCHGCGSSLRIITGWAARRLLAAAGQQLQTLAPCLALLGRASTAYLLHARQPASQPQPRPLAPRSSEHSQPLQQPGCLLHGGAR